MQFYSLGASEAGPSRALVVGDFAILPEEEYADSILIGILCGVSGGDSRCGRDRGSNVSRKKRPGGATTLVTTLWPMFSATWFKGLCRLVYKLTVVAYFYFRKFLIKIGKHILLASLSICNFPKF